MKNTLQYRVEEFNQQHKAERKRFRLKSALAIAVSISILYTMLMPAFTLERPTHCGKEGHTHTDECYEYVLDCPVTGETGTAISVAEFMKLPGAAEALAKMKAADEKLEELNDTEPAATKKEEELVVSKAKEPAQKDAATASDYIKEEKDIYTVIDRAGDAPEDADPEEPESYAVVNSFGAASEAPEEVSVIMAEEEEESTVMETSTEAVETEEETTASVETSEPENEETEAAIEESTASATEQTLPAETEESIEETTVEETTAEETESSMEETSEAEIEAEILPAEETKESQPEKTTEAQSEPEETTAAETVTETVEETPAETSAETSAAHVHTAACYKRVNICGLEEHKHNLACYADPNADVEDLMDIEALFPTFEDEKVKDSYEYAAKLAEFQKGYHESVNNFVMLVDEEDKETTQGYTRYGAWAGEDYAVDWNPLFAAFTAEYAGLDIQSYDKEALMDAYSWMQELRDVDPSLYDTDSIDPVLLENTDDEGHINLVRDVEGYVGLNYADYLEEDEEGSEVLSQAYYEEGHPAVPSVGELVFLDLEGDDFDADHVGIITAVNLNKNRMTVMLGDVDDRVKEEKFSFDAMQVLGYARLPETEEAIQRNIEVNGEPESAQELEDFGEIELESEADEEETAESLVEVETLYMEDVVTIDNGDDYTVTLNIGSDAEIPEGAEISVEEITEGSPEYNAYYEDALAANNNENAEISFARFFDITFNYEGEEIEPAAPVAVSISYDDSVEIPEEGVRKAVHFTSGGEIEVLGVAGETEEVYSDILDTTEEYAADEEQETTAAIAESVEAAALQEVKTADFSKDEAFATAQSHTEETGFLGGIKKLGRGLKKLLIKDTHDLESELGMTEAAEPESTETVVTVTENTKEETKDAASSSAASESAVKNNHKQNRKPAKVKARPADRHTFSFVQESFSVTGTVVYTVDFEYEINNHTYSFSMPGGEKISLSELVDKLGLLSGTNYTDVSLFITDVENVEFSDSSLINVVRLENDWELESLRAFDTVEELIITMNDGRELRIIVTDAMSTDSSEYQSVTTAEAAISAEAASNAVYDKNTQRYNASFKVQFKLNERPATNSRHYKIKLADGITVPDEFLNQEMPAYDSITTEHSFDYKIIKDASGDYYVLVEFLENYVNSDRPIMQNNIELNLELGKEFLQTDGSLKGEIIDNVDVTIPTNNITYPEGTNANSDISVSKVFGGYDKATNKMRYTVTVSSVSGTANPVSVEDFLTVTDGKTDIALKSINLVSVKSATGNIYYHTGDQVITGYSHTENLAEKTLSVSDLPAMNANSIYILEYEYELSDEIKDSHDFESNGSNTATANTDDITVSRDTNWSVSKSDVTLDKNGSYDSASKTVVWTINVTNSTENDLPLSDEALKGLSYSDLTIAPAPAATLTFDSTNGILTIPANSAYTITYSQTPDVTDPTQVTTVENTAAVGNPENGGKTATGTASIPAETSIQKQLMTVSGEGSERILTWRVTINVPQSGFKAGTTFKDVLSFKSDWNDVDRSKYYFTSEQKNAFINKFKAVFGDSIVEDDEDKESHIALKLINDWASSDYTGKQIVIDYQTSANIDGIDLDNNEYENTFKLNAISMPDKYSFHLPVVKKSDPGNSNDLTTVSVNKENKKLHWIVQVQLDRDTSKITVTDTLPEGVEKVTAVSMGSGEHDWQMTGLYSADGGTNWGPAESWGQGVTPWQYSSYKDVIPSASVSEGILTITADAGSNVPEYFKKNEAFYFYIEVELKDSEFPTIGSSTADYKNTASVSLDDQPYGADDQTQRVTKETSAIDKSGDSQSVWNAANGAHEITYYVDINPGGAHMCKDENGNNVSAPITLTDSISYYLKATDNAGVSHNVSMNLKQGSTKLQRKDSSGNWVDIPATEGWGYTLNEDAASPDPSRIKVKEINVYGIPDDTVLRLVYTYNVEVEDLAKNASVNLGAIRNTATLKATFEESSTHTETKEWKNAKSSASTESTGALTLVKVQKGNYALILPDTYYILERFVPTQGGDPTKDGTWEAMNAIGSSIIDPKNPNRVVYKTDSHGKLVISADPATLGQTGNFAWNQLYRVREYIAQEGYFLDSDPEKDPAGYFFFHNIETEADRNWKPDGVNSNSTATHADNLIIETDTIYHENEPIEDTITAQKRWNASTTWPQDVKSIAFALVDTKTGELVTQVTEGWENPQTLTAANTAAKWEHLDMNGKTMADFKVVETAITLKDDTVLTRDPESYLASEYTWSSAADGILYETFGGKVTNGSATIVNMSKTKLDVNKQWSSQEGIDGVEVILTLVSRERVYARNGVIEQVLPSFSGEYTPVEGLDPISLDGTADERETEAWKSSFGNLNRFRFDEDTNTLYEIEYSVTEQVLQYGRNVTDRYLMSLTTSTDGHSITVHNAPNTGRLAVRKNWQRADGTHTPPEGIDEIVISVERYYIDGNNRKVNDTTFNAENRGISITADSEWRISEKETLKWAMAFENLPRQVQVGDRTYDYHYVVKEDSIEGYSAVIENADVTLLDGTTGQISQVVITNVEDVEFHDQTDIDINLTKKFTNETGGLKQIPEGAEASFRLYRYVTIKRGTYDTINQKKLAPTVTEARTADAEFNAAENDAAWKITLPGANPVYVEDNISGTVVQTGFSGGWDNLPITETFYRNDTYTEYNYEYYITETETKDNAGNKYTAVYVTEGGADNPITIDSFHTKKTDGDQVEYTNNAEIWNVESNKSFTVRKYWYGLDPQAMPGIVFTLKRQAKNGGDWEDVSSYGTSSNGVPVYGNQTFTLVNTAGDTTGTEIQGYLLNQTNDWNLTFAGLEEGYRYDVLEVGYLTQNEQGQNIVVPFRDSEFYTSNRYNRSDEIKYVIDLSGKTYANVQSIFNNNDHLTENNYGTIGIANIPKAEGYQLGLQKKWFSFSGTGGFADVTAGYTGKGSGDKETYIVMQVYQRPYWAFGDHAGEYVTDWVEFKEPIKFSPHDVIAPDFPQYNRDGAWHLQIQSDTSMAHYGYMKNDKGVYELVYFDYKWVEVSQIPGSDGKTYTTYYDGYPNEPAKHSDNPNYYSEHARQEIENYETGFLKLIKDWQAENIANKVFFTVVDSRGNDIARKVFESKYKDYYGVTEDQVAYIRQLDKYVFVLDASEALGDKQNRWELLIKGLDVVESVDPITHSGHGEVTYTVQEVGCETRQGTVVSVTDSGYPYTAVYFRKVRFNDEQLIGNTSTGNEDGTPVVASGLQLDSGTAYNATGSLTTVRVVNNDQPNTSLTVEKIWPDDMYPDQTMKIVLELQQRQQKIGTDGKPVFQEDGKTPVWKDDKWTAAEGTTQVSVTLPRSMYSGRNAWTYTWKGLPIYKELSGSGTENPERSALWYRVVETSSPDWTDTTLVVYDADGNAMKVGEDIDISGQTGDKEHPITQKIENTIKTEDLHISKKWTNDFAAEGDKSESWNQDHSIKWPDGFEVGYKVVQHAYLVSVNNEESTQMPRTDFEGHQSSYEQKNVSYNHGFEVKEWSVDPFATGKLTAETQSVNLQDLPKGAIIRTDDNPPAGLYANYTYAVDYEYEVVETSVTCYGVTRESNVKVTETEDPKNPGTYNATIINDLTNIEVEKKWELNGSAYTPEGDESVTVQLYQSKERPEGVVPVTPGKITIYVDPMDTQGRNDMADGSIVVTVTGDNGYSGDYTLTGPDYSIQTDNLDDIAEATGNTIIYTVTVKSVDGAVIESATVNGDGNTTVGDAVTLTARAVTPPQTFALKLKNKEWVDRSNWQSTNAPDEGEITVTITASGSNAVAPIKMNSGNHWGADLDDIPLPIADSSGSIINYTVKMTADGQKVLSMRNGDTWNNVTPAEGQDSYTIEWSAEVQNQSQGGGEGGDDDNKTTWSIQAQDGIVLSNHWGINDDRLTVGTSYTLNMGKPTGLDAAMIDVVVSGADNINVTKGENWSISFVPKSAEEPVAITLQKASLDGAVILNANNSVIAMKRYAPGEQVTITVTFTENWQDMQIIEEGLSEPILSKSNGESPQTKTATVIAPSTGALTLNVTGSYYGAIITLSEPDSVSTASAPRGLHTMMKAAPILRAAATNKSVTILGENDLTPIDAVALGDPITLSGTTWSHKWENLPKMDENGDPIYYYVKELSANIPGDTEYVGTTYTYDKRNPGDAREGYSKITVTNKLRQVEPEFGSVQVTKNFEGITDEGQIPNGFTINASWGNETRELKISNMENYVDVTMSKDADKLSYTWTISNIPLTNPAPVVTFTESGYDVTGYNVTVTGSATADEKTTAKATAAASPGTATFTNTYTPKQTTFNFNKIWLDVGGNISDSTTYKDWQKGIEVTIKRKNGNGEVDRDFELKYALNTGSGTFAPENGSKRPTAEGEVNETTLSLTAVGADNVFNFKLPDNSLRMYDTNNIEWTYFVEETSLNEYTTKYGKTTKSGEVITREITLGATNAKNDGLIVNEKLGGYELPSTGGSGTTFIYLLGTLLISIAAAGILLLKKQRKTA